MKSAWLLTYVVAGAPAADMEKRQAASIDAGTRTTIVNPLNELDIASSTCSHDSTAGPYRRRASTPGLVQLWLLIFVLLLS
jgi:hypothetical protein